MSHPMAIQELQDDEAGEERDGVEFAEPLLAAIQQSYEEAKASIDDVPRSTAPGRTAAYPGTEKIDLRLVKPPVRAVTAPTAAMSLAARVVAERSASEGVGRRGAPEAPTAPRRRLRWWRP